MKKLESLKSKKILSGNDNISSKKGDLSTVVGGFNIPTMPWNDCNPTITGFNEDGTRYWIDSTVKAADGCNE